MANQQSISSKGQKQGVAAHKIAGVFSCFDAYFVR
jgi:hypothetical protein